MKSVDVRNRLVEALRLDLIGPSNGSELESEVLDTAPSRWYLTGYLVPLEASEAQRMDETSDDETFALTPDTDGTDDANAPEPPASRRAFFPSSMGMSLIVPASVKSLKVAVRWGDYANDATVEAVEALPVDEPISVPEDSAKPHPYRWRRTQREEHLSLKLPARSKKPVDHKIPNEDGLKVALSIRPVEAPELAPSGARAVSVFVVNRRTPTADERCDERFAFQVELEVITDEPLIPRPNVRGLRNSDDRDERIADLQYRDAFEFAVGHGVATHAEVGPDGHCHKVTTCWLPSAEVERVAPGEIEGVELSMEALAGLESGEQARAALGNLVVKYREWQDGQRAAIPDDPRRREVAEDLLNGAKVAANRIEAGIAALTDPQVLDAFRIANKTMARAARRRFGTMRGSDEKSVPAPKWRPFQLAFLLMNLPGIVDPHHDDREAVDLLFFPTGGGKTEAYLGLSAFTLVLRRLRNPGLASAGLSVLMRYTLRLLTLDQLGRASTLICALELERKADPEKLGPWPFEIGLWVGRAATPNRMGAKGNYDPNTARNKTIAFWNDDRKPSPIPLEECPWCGEKFTARSFELRPNKDQPIDLVINCKNRHCDFSRGQPLPIQAVDEPIYRRLPCFLIATVDKFAAMPWIGQVGAFFGHVQRHDSHGFYGPCDPLAGGILPAPLLPPDLIIQDELHLISGPMGTMVGLYESALDELCSRTVGTKKIRPKIIASTATVRRADSQIRALFNRPFVEVFPPPVPDRRDSFFAKVLRPDEGTPRLYLGIAAQGRSPKVLLLRAYLALLGAAQKAYLEAGGKKDKDNPADPYMTLLGYFNSLRELGGSRRIVEDEVNTRLTGYAARRRVGQAEGSFANRSIAYEVVELTSRVNTAKVAEAKRKLALPFHESDKVDVAIATNMISVGLDITRLGLMVVNGQPKTCAEYIQATSRVGRDVEKPGLIVTLLNIHKPRDRSHYERFAAFHESFYRSVEATSVTPFSPRALDRGLAGTLVALARLGHVPMTPPRGASQVLQERARLDFAAHVLANRARTHALVEAPRAEALRQRVLDRSKDLLDEWEFIANDLRNKSVELQYQREVGAAQPLLRDFLDPELNGLPPRHQKFRANRSMRDVEPSVNVWMRTLEDIEIEEDRE